MEKQHIGILERISMKYHLLSGLDRDDLFSAACIAYMHAKKTHDPAKCKESTWIWRCVENQMKNECKTSLRKKRSRAKADNYYNSIGETFGLEQLQELVSFEWSAYTLTPERIVAAKQTLESVSKDSKALLKKVMRCPAHILGSTPFDSRKGLRELLKKEGWSAKRINNCFTELTNLLTEDI